MGLITNTFHVRLTVEVTPRGRSVGKYAVELLTKAQGVFGGASVSVFLGIEDGRTICRAIGMADSRDPELQHRIKALVDFASSE
jgi:hypothetical protein